ncbi:MAG: type II-A CRISPR-associated protein Csn2 [Clostridia bacterium]|nr:type II-A CRISPR-associated protein Csn2 [Clostridia bacterium]
MITAAFSYTNNVFNIYEEKANTLVIENKKLFRNVIFAFLSNNEQEYFTFADNFNPFDFGKKGYFISNPINPDLSNKKLVTKVNDCLSNMINNEYSQELSLINSSILNLADNLIRNSSYEMTYETENIDAISLIKLLSFHLIYDNRTLAETLVSFIVLMKQYLKYDLFVIADLHLYFTPEEISEIYKTLLLNHITVFILENSYTGVIPDAETVCIIDNDLCLIDKGNL